MKKIMNHFEHCALKRHFIAIFLGLVMMVSCDRETKKTPPRAAEKAPVYVAVSPAFNADSAYYFVQKQVDFGPRVTGSAESKKCGEWMVRELRKYADNVIDQKAQITNFDNRKLNIINIIAEFNPKATKRIALFTHWDSRPYADKDNIDPDKPIPGANDGASGTGVLIQIAQILKAKPTDVGIDLVFFDAEDLGKTEHRNSYCLGSQYWSKNLHKPGYKATYGILLDMVGATNAIFGWEEYSVEFAKPIVEKVWGVAQNLGYSKHFQYTQVGGIEDDHYYVNKNAGIPTIDIIHCDKGFPDHHHTHRDNMSVIDRNTLKAVGQTVLEVIYSEKP